MDNPTRTTERRLWLNGKQVAEAIGLDPKTLRKYVRNGNPLAPPPIPDTKPPKWWRVTVESWGEAA